MPTHTRTAALLLALTAGAAQAQVATGRVVDAVTSAGVASARVTAADSAGREAATVRTAEDGSFVLRLGGAGAWTFRAERIGYRDGHASRAAGPGDSLHLTMRMMPRSVHLDSLTVSARAAGRPLTLDVAGSFRRRIATADSTAGSATATGERRRIAIGGSTLTPDPCHRLAGGLSTRGSIITLLVEAHDTGEVCQPVTGLLGYSAVIGNVQPGRYVLRVIHDYPGLGWAPRLALETEVTVR